MLDYLAGFFATVSLIAIPVYLSNGFALLFGGGRPLDLGKRFVDGKPLLGKGKTIRGTLAGIFFGSMGSLAVSAFFPQLAAFIPANYVHYGALLAAGAMVGDIAASFSKRRLGLAQGKSVILLDQLDFLAGGILLGMTLFVPTIGEVLFLAAFTFSMNRFANLVAFNTRIKKVPW
jgi:CDP-2,3-bis-(O-geranylgeranyl)-sn-glycerol synthase